MDKVKEDAVVADEDFMEDMMWLTAQITPTALKRRMVLQI